MKYQDYTIAFSGDTTFINQLVDFDKDNIPDKILMKISKYTTDPTLSPTELGLLNPSLSVVFCITVLFE